MTRLRLEGWVGYRPFSFPKILGLLAILGVVIQAWGGTKPRKPGAPIAIESLLRQFYGPLFVALESPDYLASHGLSEPGADARIAAAIRTSELAASWLNLPADEWYAPVARVRSHMHKLATSGELYVVLGAAGQNPTDAAYVLPDRNPFGKKVLLFNPTRMVYTINDLLDRENQFRNTLIRSARKNLVFPEDFLRMLLSMYWHHEGIHVEYGNLLATWIEEKNALETGFKAQGLDKMAVLASRDQLLAGYVRKYKSIELTENMTDIQSALRLLEEKGFQPPPLSTPIVQVLNAFPSAFAQRGGPLLLRGK